MKQVLIQKIDNDIQFMKAIAKRQKIDIVTVSGMLRWNTLTTSQLAALTGKTEMAIRGMFQPGTSKGKPADPKLTRCYTHPEVEFNEKGIGVEVEGRMFVHRDEKCEKLLRECNS